MKRIICILIFCVLPFVLWANLLTIEQALEIAKNNNRDYNLAMKQYGDQVSLTNRKNSFMPSVGISGSASTGGNFLSSGSVQNSKTGEVVPIQSSLPEWNGKFSTGLSVSLSLNGSSYMDREYKKVSNAASLLTLENAELSLKTDVIESYLNIDMLREHLNVYRSNLETKKKTYDTTYESYNAGLVDQISLIQAANAVSAADVLVSSGETDLSLAEIDFLNKTGINISQYELEDLNNVKFITLPKPAEILDKYANSILALRTYKQAIETAEYNYKVARLSQSIPTVSFSASYGGSGGVSNVTANNKFGDSLNGSVSVSIPVSNFFGSSNSAISKDRAKFAAEDARAQYENTLINILYRLEQTSSGLTKTQTQIQNLEQTLETSMILSNLTEDAYKNGLKTLTNVLDAQATVYSSEYELLSTKSSYLNAVYTLALYLGMDRQTLENGI